MKYLLIALLFIASDGRAQKDTARSGRIRDKWTDARGAHMDTMVITANRDTIPGIKTILIDSGATTGSMTQEQWEKLRALSIPTLATHSIGKPDTIAAIILYCDTTEGEHPGMDNTTLRFVNNGCYWMKGYAIVQVNQLSVYLDENKKPFDKIVWLWFSRRKPLYIHSKDTK